MEPNQKTKFHETSIKTKSGQQTFNPNPSLKAPIYRRPCCQKEEMNEESAIERVGWKHLLSYIKCDNECGRMRMNLLLRRDP